MTNSSTLQISSKPLKIVINDKLIKWNTARLISESLSKFRFLDYYENVNKDVYDLYVYLKKYSNSYYDQYAGLAEAREDLIKHLDNMRRFQDLVNSEDPSIDLKSVAMDMFSNGAVKCSISIESIEIERLEIIEEYCRSISTLFNNLLSLTHSAYPLTNEMMSEIFEILRNKGLDEFEIPEHLLIIN